MDENSQPPRRALLSDVNAWLSARQLSLQTAGLALAVAASLSLYWALQSENEVAAGLCFGTVLFSMLLAAATS